MRPLPRAEARRRTAAGQPGARSHKRVQREGLPVRKEVLQPPPAACVCAQCGKAFRRNGETVSKRVEIRVRAHIRHIRRPRYRASCRCAQQRGLAVPEGQAELEPTLFRGSKLELTSRRRLRPAQFSIRALASSNGPPLPFPLTLRCRM